MALSRSYFDQCVSAQITVTRGWAQFGYGFRQCLSIPRIHSACKFVDHGLPGPRSRLWCHGKSGDVGHEPSQVPVIAGKLRKQHIEHQGYRGRPACFVNAPDIFARCRKIKQGLSDNLRGQP
jgi:hypothetical protein